MFRGCVSVAWMHFRSGFSVSEEEFLLEPFSLLPKIRFNVDRLSHVTSSDGLTSLDGPKAQLVTLGHSPHTHIVHALYVVFIKINLNNKMSFT